MSGDGPLAALGATGLDALLAIGPLAVLLLLFQQLFLRRPWVEIARMLAGLAVAGVGLFLFLYGVAIAYIPFGRALGAAVATVGSDWLVVAIGLALGLCTAFGEPAVRILAHQVEDASAGSIRRSVVVLSTCVGVALAVALGLLRIVHGIPLLHLLVPGYLLVIVLMWFSHRDFVAVGVDAGGVATGPLANTFLLAVALGASAGLGDDDPVVSGLGLASLICVAPIVSVMTLGVIVRRKQRKREKRQ